MKLSAKIEYGAKAILELAIRQEGARPVPLTVISKSQNIPKKFLIHLLLQLKNAGIVNSSRGMEGGYYLARPPEKISLADVFRALDNQILRDSERPGAGGGTDIIRAIWNKTQNEAIQRLEISFEDLKIRAQASELSYSI